VRVTVFDGFMLASRRARSLQSTMIVLTVKSFNGAPTDALSASFDELGGTIGRADSNQLVLPDPERLISRIHAQVVFRNGGYALVDRGSNPVLVNGKPLGNGREAPLRDGDAVQIGGYLLSASMDHKTLAANTFADRFGGGASAARAAPFPVTSASVARPFPPSKPVAAPVAASSTTPDLALNTPWPLAPPQPATRPGATPPGAMLSRDQPLREGKVITLPAVRRPPAPAAVADMPDVPGSVVGEPASPPAPDALMQALCEGLGVPHLQLQTLGTEQLRLIGQLLRESTRGTVELLLARAAFKREMRAEVTTLVARDNNPLKFSPTVEDALQHLLGQTASGFMAPAAAMRDAFDDLRAHQSGVMAGMRAALEGVLQRFDPKVLEGQLSKQSGLSGLLPGSRKAQLWEAFQQLYEQLSQEAADDFQVVFGKAFLQAYEQHIAQLQSE
jgi:FHA domain-containing protein/type VI secretion system protein